MMVYFTGFMGSGKSTIGSIIGKCLDYQVIDTDDYLQKKYGKSISDLFAKYGEEKFRDLESAALKEIKDEFLIVTTGGGMVMRKENRDFMKENGFVIFLDVSLDQILYRLEGDTTRPLMQKPLQEIEALYLERQPLYREADLIVDIDSLNIPQIVQLITDEVYKVSEARGYCS
ncbi:shikimate kinase [Alkalihalobacterium bogoriense]|uniref:shikimate kinase n=1 Tax=Alkalihalobacterium bogoriense TaxID=246272 RepID=UPI00047E4646|nr:shikimate kinase [Alkalihalobacterium bogoriense]